MVLKRNGIIVKAYEPSYVNEKIAIAIDSSKTNTAIVVGNTYGDILADYEIDGKSDTNVLFLCKQQRDALKLLFEGAKVDVVGIEDIITKKGKKGEYTSGLDIHQSRFKITAVFMSLICFFQDNFKLTPMLVNNQSWKSATLPEEYRTKQHKKGSLDFEKDMGSKYSYRTDDVTDAVHIYEYICIQKSYKKIYRIESPCETTRSYSMGLLSPTIVMPNTAMQFEVNKELSIRQNCDTMVSKMRVENDYAYAKVFTRELSIEDIYKLSSGASHTECEEFVYLVCKLKER